MLDRVEKELAARGLRPVENQKLESRSPGRYDRRQFWGELKRRLPNLPLKAFAEAANFFLA